MQNPFFADSTGVPIFFSIIPIISPYTIVAILPQYTIVIVAILLMEVILHHLKSQYPRNYSSLGPLGGARFHPSTKLPQGFAVMAWCAEASAKVEGKPCSLWTAKSPGLFLDPPPTLY